MILIPDSPAPASAPAPTPAPETLEQALPLLKRFALEQAKVALIEAARAAELAAVNAAKDKAIAPRLARLADLRAALETWWKSDGANHLKGDRKSAELGGCKIGTKLGNFTLAIPGDDAAAIKAIRGLRLSATCLRVVTSLDKVATLKLVRAIGLKGDRLKAAGFGANQAETFVLERLEGAPIGKGER